MHDDRCQDAVHDADLVDDRRSVVQPIASGVKTAVKVNVSHHLEEVCAPLRSRLAGAVTLRDRQQRARPDARVGVSVTRGAFGGGALSEHFWPEKAVVVGRWAARYAWRVNAKEKLLELAPHWSEEQAELALRAVEGTDTSDDWGEVSNVQGAGASNVLRRLAEDERAAGHEPW